LIPLLRGNTLVITLDGRAYELTTQNLVEVLETLTGFFTRYDPDLLLTHHTDTAILPQLLALARASIGTILTAMQLDLAVRRRLLIPWRKGEPERWETVELLLKVDKGGLAFQPPVGVFAHVAELDYAPMYPTWCATTSRPRRSSAAAATTRRCRRPAMRFARGARG
jgi:DNA polymerase elongation subunit (family B)